MIRRVHFARAFGVAAFGLVVLSIGARPPVALRAEPSGAFQGPVNAVAGPPPQVRYLAAAPRSAAELKTWLKLQDRVSMPFANDTPLADVVKYIQQATAEEKTLPAGIAIYVDPQGLQDADKTMASTVAINLDGMPLEKTLRLLLRQIGLTYFVDKDGLLIITTPDEAATFEPTEAILRSLESLHEEVGRLEAEVRALRHGDAGPRPEAPTARPTAGGMGGGFR